MGRGIHGKRGKPGGIISLVRLAEEHDRALEYDLLTRTGRTLSELMDMGAGGRLALLSFISHLPPDSALNRELHPKDKFGEWYSTVKTNAILADIFDLVMAAHTKKGAKPKEYPRPKKKQSVGKGAVPVSEFWEWWNKER